MVLAISNLEYGGAQRQVVELANKMDSARFDVQVCSLSDYVPLAHELCGREGRLHIIRKRFKFDVTVVSRLAGLLRQLGADIVHGFLFDAEIAARLAGRLAGTPVVLGSERNADYELKRRKWLVYRMTRRSVDWIVANSKAGAAFSSRVLRHDADRYRVVYNGVDVEHFRPQDGREVRRELGIGDDEQVVGTFASFKEQKNHPLLFKAARHVLARFPRTRFLLVGDTLYAGMHGSREYRARMAQLVEELGIRERCLFLGNRDDVVRLYGACDVTVLPSLFEGTPNVVLESMACGVPVVATAVSDNTSVVPDGRVGYLVPLGDDVALAERIVELLGDEGLRRRMGREARAWVEREFSTSRMVRDMGEVYLACLRKKRGGC